MFMNLNFHLQEADMKVHLCNDLLSIFNPFLTNIIKYYMIIVKSLIIEFNIDYLRGMAS